LSKVKFHRFRNAIKKYGYKSPLTKDHLRAICDLIDLDIDKLTTKPTSSTALIYNDPNFTLKDGIYDTHRLLLIGYLYCTYEDVETHISDLWLLINA
jgi:hypothetical protein